MHIIDSTPEGFRCIYKYIYFYGLRETLEQNINMSFACDNTNLFHEPVCVLGSVFEPLKPASFFRASGSYCFLWVTYFWHYVID